MGWEFLLEAGKRNRKSARIFGKGHKDIEGRVLGSISMLEKEHSREWSERRKNVWGEGTSQSAFVFCGFPLVERFSNIAAAFQGA